MQRIVAATARAGVLLLAACGTNEGSAEPAATPPVTSGVPVEPSDETSDDALAPIAGLRTVSGEAFDVDALAGQPAVLWFWAPWCVICAAEGPEVAELAGRHEGEVAFVGVAGRGALADMERFIAATGTDGLVHVADLDGAAWAEFGVYGQPAFAFIDPRGDAPDVDVFVGSLGARALTERVAELL